MSGQAVKVLVVEDNELNMELICEVLELAGFEVLRAAEARSALTIATEHRPDLILMDIQLPGMDGLDATRALKADPATASIPVAAVTSHAMQGERERAVEAGCTGYFSKPIDIATFAADLKKLLEG